MLKFIIPAIIVFLIVLFWEKINELIFKKFGIQINYFVTVLVIIAIIGIFTLLYY